MGRRLLPIFFLLFTPAVGCIPEGIDQYVLAYNQHEAPQRPNRLYIAFPNDCAEDLRLVDAIEGNPVENCQEMAAIIQRHIHVINLDNNLELSPESTCNANNVEVLCMFFFAGPVLGNWLEMEARIRFFTSELTYRLNNNQVSRRALEMPTFQLRPDFPQIAENRFRDVYGGAVFSRDFLLCDPLLCDPEAEIDGGEGGEEAVAEIDDVGDDAEGPEAEGLNPGGGGEEAVAEVDGGEDGGGGGAGTPSGGGCSLILPK